MLAVEETVNVHKGDQLINKSQRVPWNSLECRKQCLQPSAYKQRLVTIEERRHLAWSTRASESVHQSSNAITVVDRFHVAFWCVQSPSKSIKEEEKYHNTHKTQSTIKSSQKALYIA